MDPKHLMQLAIIVELGSVTKAARKLNLTQPTLSRTVKIIEDRAGGAVLRRGRYGVTATEIGARLAAEGRAILRSSEQAQVAVQEWRNGLVGELRVGVGPMLAATLMGDFFAETIQNPPSYSLKLHCEVAARLAKRLRDDELDLAIIPYELDRQDDGLFRERIFREHLSIFVGAEDPLAGKTGIAPQELAQYNWISVGAISGLFDITRENLDWLGLPTVTPGIEISGDVTMTFRMLEKTKSCAMMPFRLAGRYQERYRVAPVGLTVELPSRNFGLWSTMASRDRPGVVDFIERLNRYLAKTISRPGDAI
ncbi:LysR family transcriptional regulator [Alphaproteobacteria bacterium KMM 3653]|uniref:LysR family transcriptional regulator n=1 Tax=Harenicola maris TaxID=2841044 RepID=A0AAP2CJX8_9RHOB|nr:LysR family transcriptional regulator [Harenicola maris]